MGKRYSDLANSLADGNWVNSNTPHAWPSEASKEDMDTAALLDIAQSLRTIVQLLRCPNVARGFQSMSALQNLAREFWVKPTKRKKRAKVNQ